MRYAFIMFVWAAMPAFGQDTNATVPETPAPTDTVSDESAADLVEQRDEMEEEACSGGLILQGEECLDGLALVQITNVIQPSDKVPTGESKEEEKKKKGKKKSEEVATEQPEPPFRLASFWISNTEITQGQYEAIMGFNPSKTCNVVLSSDRPVSCVSWNDAVAFSNALSEAAGLQPAYALNDKGQWVWNRKSDGFRLPSEAEWTRAARGERKSVFAGTDNPKVAAWYRHNARGGVRPVAGLLPNDYGLYDMSGNVWEWVWDGYQPGIFKPFVNERLLDTSGRRLQMGGSYADESHWLVIGARDWDDARYYGKTVGFRVARNGQEVGGEGMEERPTPDSSAPTIEEPEPTPEEPVTQPAGTETTIEPQAEPGV